MGSGSGRADLGLLVLRVVAGLAWAVALLESVGGLALVLGVLTRPVAALFALEMAVTTLRVKLPRGVGFIGATGAGWELDFVLLGCALTLVLLGPGSWSVDAALGRAPQREQA